VSVIYVVEVSPGRQFDVEARDDVAAQNRVAVTADTGCVVSACHAGDVDSEAGVNRSIVVSLK